MKKSIQDKMEEIIRKLAHIYFDFNSPYYSSYELKRADKLVDEAIKIVDEIDKE